MLSVFYICHSNAGLILYSMLLIDKYMLYLSVVVVQGDMGPVGHMGIPGPNGLKVISILIIFC